MMRKLLLFSCLLLWAASAGAMSGEGCGAGVCADCHSLSAHDAAALLGDRVDSVLNVDLAEVPGMWEVKVEKGGEMVPYYVDFSKQYLVTGGFVRLADASGEPGALPQAAPVAVEAKPVAVKAQPAAVKSAKSQKPRPSESPQVVDLTRIPLDDALLLGRESAATRVIIFTDPKCKYCRKLHAELKTVVARNPEVAFLIKMYPLAMHNPEAYYLSKSIVCNKSLELLDLAFAGKPLPPAYCTTEAVDQTMALAKDLGIRGTPAMVLPDGNVVGGYRPAQAIETILREYVEKTAAK